MYLISSRRSICKGVTYGTRWRLLLKFGHFGIPVTFSEPEVKTLTTRVAELKQKNSVLSRL